MTNIRLLNEEDRGGDGTENEYLMRLCISFISSNLRIALMRGVMNEDDLCLVLITLQ